MSQQNLEFEPIVREYLDSTNQESEARIFGLLFQYLDTLYEDSEDPILLEDFSAYEADDFLNFFLEDNFQEEFPDLRSESLKTFQNFLKFLSRKKLSPPEEMKEWKEVLK